MANMKMRDLDVLEEKSEHEEDGDRFTNEGFYKSAKTVAINAKRKPQAQK